MLNEKFIINRINGLCETHNMSIYALSKKSGISQSSLSNLMNRGSMPTFNTLNKICSAFDITLSQFFAEEGIRLNLTNEQKMVLDVWDSLSEGEEEKVTLFVKGMTSI